MESAKIGFAGTSLTRAGRRILDGVAQVLTGCPDASGEVAGHIGSPGSEAATKSVGERRTQSVVDYLVSKGVLAERLTASRYEDSHPLADNSTATGREAERRIEFVVKS